MPNPAWVESLLADAEVRVHGSDFNRVSFERRAAADEAFGHAVPYEVQIDVATAPEAFAEAVIAKLQVHLQGKRLDVKGPRGLLVWLWHEDHAHLFAGPAIFEALRPLIPPPATLMLSAPSE